MSNELTREQQKRVVVRNSQKIWLALLVPEVLTLGIFLVMAKFGNHTYQSDPLLRRICLTMSITVLMVTIPLGYFLRIQAYKKAWEGNAVTPLGYFNGNVKLWLCCLMAASLSIVFFYVTGFWPLLLIALAAFIVQVANYPTGRPMEPDEASYGNKSTS